MFSASADTLTYLPAEMASTQLTWYDRRGNLTGTVGTPAHYTNPALSPDGKRIIVAKTGPQTAMRDLWLLNERGVAVRLTLDPKDDMNPAWSPDGARIAFSSERTGTRDVYVKNATGTGDEVLIVSSSPRKSVAEWSRDGRLVFYEEEGAIRAVAVDGDRKPYDLARPCRCDQRRLSPDGKWLAYRSAESGRDEVYVQSVGRMDSGFSS
jgi:eukaryotic-like serine/threonine-protein kinase